MASIVEELSSRVSGIVYDKPRGSCAIPLDKNENLHVPRELVAEVLREALRETDPRLYPEPGVEEELSQAIARLYGVDPDMVVLTSGADEAIALMLDAVRLAVSSAESSPLSVALKPSYPMYHILSSSRGFRVEYVRVNSGDFSLDVSELAEKSSRASIVFLCDPNNPTGNTLGEEVVETASLATRGIVVVDETYMLFSDSPRSYAGRWENVAVIGTFSKAFGLAGLRLGYIVADSRLAEALRVLRTPYQVSSVALRSGLAALRRVDEFRRHIDSVRRARRVFLEKLGETPLLVAYYSQTNFILAESRTPARVLASRLEKRGVCVRVYESLFAPGDSYIRVSVPPWELLDLVASVIRDAASSA